MDAIKSLFSDFDPGAFIPEVTTIIGWVELALRIAVMAGPLLLLGFGLVYLLAAPKEANHSLGYRCWWGMTSLDAWQFTQRLAGSIWGALGLVLTIVMSLLCNAFRRMEPMDMIYSAGKCLLWELGLVVLACLAINITLICVFDRKGFRRSENRKLRAQEAEESDEEM